MTKLLYKKQHKITLSITIFCLRVLAAFRGDYGCELTFGPAPRTLSRIKRRRNKGNCVNFNSLFGTNLTKFLSFSGQKVEIFLFFQFLVGLKFDFPIFKLPCFKKGTLKAGTYRYPYPSLA